MPTNHLQDHPQAKFIIDTLFKEGYVAYYAGGWVRDYLLGHPSDDIDIATNASPETIQALFPKTVPIGLAFGIILVIIEGNEYEVATFRNDFDYCDGRRPSRIEFTTAEEDAKRRDFTINGMFYNPCTGEILDYVNGKEDLKRKIIRAIGNPHQRIQEDRLRMIRAIRLSCRFDFEIEKHTAQAILDHSTELFPSVAIERVVQELEKAHKSQKLCQVLSQLHKYHLLQEIFPELKSISTVELEKRMIPIPHFPHRAPLIAFLLSLFPGLTLERQLELCKQLKRPTVDSHFIQLYQQLNQTIQKGSNTELVEWAHLYTQAEFTIALQVKAAFLSDEERTSLIQEHADRKIELQADMDRIKSHSPIIQAKDLLAEGIKPSKTMGNLLKEAERIAINQRQTNPAHLMRQLKTSPLWPEQTAEN